MLLASNSYDLIPIGLISRMPAHGVLCFYE